MDAEEQADNQRRVNRARFRHRMHVAIYGNDADRVAAIRDWKPVQDMIDDRHRSDDEEPGVPGVANL